MLAVIGVVLVLVDSVVIKLFDTEIRKAQWKKAVASYTFIAGMVLFIVGIISLIIGIGE